MEHPLCYYEFGVSPSKIKKNVKTGGYKAAGFKFDKEVNEWKTEGNSNPYQWSCYVCHWQNAGNYTVCSDCGMEKKNYIHMELSYLPISDEDFEYSIDKDVKEAYTEQVKEMAGYNMDFALNSIEQAFQVYQLVSFESGYDNVLVSCDLLDMQ